MQEHDFTSQVLFEPEQVLVWHENEQVAWTHVFILGGIIVGYKHL